MREYDLVFVGGAPRSGTTLVQKMLNAHSDIYGGPEFDRFGDIVHLRNLLLNTNKKGRNSAYFNSEQLDYKVSEFIIDLLKDPATENNARIICEKTPNNIFHLNDLLNIHQEAKGVIVIRDPRAIVASMKNVKKKAKEANESIPGFTKTTNKSIMFIEKYWKAGLHAVKNHSDRIEIIIYEELIAQPKDTITKLCTFLDVQYQEQMVQPGKSNFDRGVQKDNIWYTGKDHSRNIDTSSLEKWKNDLTKFDQELVEQNLMKQYNLWVELSKKSSSIPPFSDEKPKGIRHSIVNWLTRNEKIRGSLSRLIKDSYSTSR